MTSQVPRPVALVILDGWGINPSCSHNAVCLARTPRLDGLLQDWPHTRLRASGLDVGLPDGQMGNSEVGHLNIGAGRIVYQDLTRIGRSIEEGEFFRNPVLVEVMAKVRRRQGTLHLMGLLSDGGVHSHLSHVFALVEMARQQGIEELCIHAFLDGRDTPPQSGAGYLADLERELTRQGLGRVVTVMGRYWAMDRDNRWERVKRAYAAMVQGAGPQFPDSAAAITAASK